MMVDGELMHIFMLMGVLKCHEYLYVNHIPTDSWEDKEGADEWTANREEKDKDWIVSIGDRLSPPYIH